MMSVLGGGECRLSGLHDHGLATEARMAADGPKRRRVLS